MLINRFTADHLILPSAPLIKPGNISCEVVRGKYSLFCRRLTSP